MFSGFFKFQGAYLLIPFVRGAVEGFYVVFYVGCHVFKSVFIVEGLVAPYTGVAVGGVGICHFYIGGPEFFYQGLQGGGLQFGFVGGVGGFVAYEHYEVGKVLGNAVVALLGDGDGFFGAYFVLVCHGFGFAAPALYFVVDGTGVFYEFFTGPGGIEGADDTGGEFFKGFEKGLPGVGGVDKGVFGAAYFCEAVTGIGTEGVEAVELKLCPGGVVVCAVAVTKGDEGFEIGQVFGVSGF